jgi:molecular chaperone HscB
MQSLDLKQNYFDLFDIDIGFDIEKAKLRVRQQQLQAEFHPDRFVTGSDLEKRLSVQQASWVNEAYQTLIDPVKRSRYLLKLCGVEVNDESETTSDTAFLMEQIELREELDACRSHPEPLQQCDVIEHKIKAKLQTLADEFVDDYQSGKLDQAMVTSRKMQFIQRLQEQVSEMQLELEEANY